MIAIKCSAHPGYKAKVKPKLACFACWFMWKIAEICRNPDSNLNFVEEKDGRKQNSKNKKKA